jgi:hypothetical protein
MMLEHLQRFTLGMTAIAAVMAAMGSRPSAGANTADLRIARDTSTVSIFDGNRLVLRYRYADVPQKPYVDKLTSPAGAQVLRDSPSDHKHHHGLMYALAVEGVNFWEESEANSGRQRQKSLVTGRNGFAQELDWLGPASDKPLLVERRTVGVLRAGDLGATLVEWRSRFQTPPGKEAIVLGGHPYFGLGMRLLVSMDSGGRFFNADDAAGESIGGNPRLTSTKWCAYTAKADGKPVTVAVFDHPANLRHPAKMFTMTQPFAYLSATLNAAKAPITLKAGNPLDLCYGVALWDGEVDKATVEKAYRRWLVLSASNSAQRAHVKLLSFAL